MLYDIDVKTACIAARRSNPSQRPYQPAMTQTGTGGSFRDTTPRPQSPGASASDSCEKLSVGQARFVPES